MILKTMRLENFRQYYGHQRVTFANSKDRNVTVIHGENGHGKTAFLNAFVWCLYGESDYTSSDRLINERAEAEAAPGTELNVSVMLQFEVDKLDYTIVRAMRYRKDRIGEIVPLSTSPTLTVEFVDATGRLKTPSNPQVVIDQILPPRLKQYFFFDGERIDNLSKDANTDQVQDAVRNLMGLEVLERSMLHLDDVRKRFRSKQKEHANAELQRLLEEEAATESSIETYKSELKEMNKNARAIDDSIAAIDARLRELNDSRADQLNRDRLGRQRNEISESITSLEGKIRSTVSTHGHLAFSAHLLSVVTDILDQKRAKGEIPAGIKAQFVDDLIESGTCICGRDIVPGTPPYATVSKWRERAGNSQLEDHFIQSSSNLKFLRSERSRLFNELRGFIRQKEEFEFKLQTVEEELDEVSTRLSHKGSEEVGALESSRHEKRQTRNDIQQKIGMTKHVLATAEESLRELKKQRSVSEKKDMEQQLSAARANACEEAYAVIGELYHTLADIVRGRVQSRLDDIYGRFLRKGYRAALSEDYQLQILKEVDGDQRVVEMSQGERQITSLSFIGALVDIAREQHRRKDNSFFRGGIYPIVMDSPFGSLDKDHKARIATGIPQLAHQVVVMATDSQWKGEVADAMSRYVGSEYTLRNHQPKKDASVKYEFTQLEEGYNA